MIRNLLCLVSLFAFFTPQISLAQGNSGHTKLTVSKDVMIKFKQNIDIKSVEKHGGKLKKVLKIINGISARIPAEAWDSLKNNSNVEYIEIDAIAHASKGKPLPGDPLSNPQDTPWGINRINAPQVWGQTSGASVKVAVVDSGAGSNSDLNIVGGYDFVNNDSDPTDDNEHGTHVSGTIAAIDDGDGVVGGAHQASLYAVKVLDRRGSGSYSNIIAGIQWCIDNGMQVINMSLGGSSDSQAMHDAIIAATNAGILVVVAAGNEAQSGNPVGFPAAYEEVLSVGATDINNNIASFSSHGYYVDIAAPGVNITSTIPNDRQDAFNGTSMASPHVAAVAALVISANPGMTPAQVKARLIETATDLGSPGRDNYFGAGLVNAYLALNPPVPLANDVGVTAVTAQAQAAINENIPVSVSVKNNGTNDESVTVSIGSEVQIVFLSAGSSDTLVFSHQIGPNPGTESITASASILVDENSANDVLSTNVVVIDPSAVTVIYAGAISYSDNKKNLFININVSDANTNPIANATVNINLYLNGSLYASGAAATGSTGLVSFKLRNAPSGFYTTGINSISKTGTFIYDSSLNATDPGFTR